MNFLIENRGEVSKEFLKRKVLDFNTACQYVAELPYRRNRDKSKVDCVFDDEGGTCSTKHATLRKLALENQHSEVRLILGIFKMDAAYTSCIQKTLAQYQLNYIPEAHNYLKIGNDYLDFTKPNSNYNQFKDKILLQQEIEFDEINKKKNEIHQAYLSHWIQLENLTYNLEEIWSIREQCIQDLQGNC